jgi:hypothetical protein
MDQMISGDGAEKALRLARGLGARRLGLTLSCDGRTGRQLSVFVWLLRRRWVLLLIMFVLAPLLAWMRCAARQSR